jgi:hypothetical protein
MYFDRIYGSGFAVAYAHCFAITCIALITQATGYLGAGTGEDDASSLAGMGGNLVQLTPETIKDLGSEQIYKV